MRNLRIKPAILLVFLLLVVGNSFAQEEKSVTDYEPLDYTGMAKILIRVEGPYQYDSVYFENGVAVYNQDKYDDEIGWLYALGIDKNMVHYVILEKGTITFTATKDSLIFITGTPNNDAFFTLDKEIEPLRMKMKTKGYKVKKLRQQGKDKEADMVQDEILEISKIWWGKQVEFATTNNNMAGLNYVVKLSSRFTTDELKTILKNYEHFSDKNAYKKIMTRYQAELKTNVGVPAPEFSLRSDKDEVLSLSSIRKKLTIIDFWASWCKPCRAENPNLISLYNHWKNNGLEIVSVSIDKKKDKEKWLTAIEEDQLTWLQVWDEEGLVIKDYGVSAVPRTFLIDEKGTVVAKDLRGEDLNTFVEEYLGAKR